MSKVTISLAEFDELRGVKEKFDNLVEDAREKIREEFVDKVTEMAKEIGRKDGIINELQNKNDELDILKKRYDDLFNRYLRLLNRGLLARIFRKGENENG